MRKLSRRQYFKAIDDVIYRHWRHFSDQPNGALMREISSTPPRVWRTASRYRFIARNRYRVFGRREQCFMPRAEDAARFI
jgi:predicted DCC family thiol-disulfide oxidoreductase YuxK